MLLLAATQFFYAYIPGRRVRYRWVLGLSLLGFGLGEVTAAVTGFGLLTLGNLHVAWDAAYIVVLQGLSHAFRR